MKPELCIFAWFYGLIWCSYFTEHRYSFCIYILWHPFSFSGGRSKNLTLLARWKESKAAPTDFLYAPTDFLRKKFAWPVLHLKARQAKHRPNAHLKITTKTLFVKNVVAANSGRLNLSEPTKYMHLKAGGTAGALRPPGERSAGPGLQRADGLREGALPANWRCARPENKRRAR